MSTIEPGMRRIIESTVEALGCTAELIVEHIDIPIINSDIHLNDIARNEAKDITATHHNPAFDVDEGMLHSGAGIYAQFAVDFLAG